MTAGLPGDAQAQDPPQGLYPDGLAWARGRPEASGLIRERPEDFQVEERLSFDPAGEGGHLYLRVRKRDANTRWVAGRIAALAGCRAAEVGYAGLKDRQALAEQWFSVPMPGAEPDWDGIDGCVVLERRRHPRKLRTGALAGNRFIVRVREVQGDRSEIEARAARIEASGVPSYFGPQRFGHGGGNLRRATAMFAGELRVRDRHRRGLYLSAARAEIFNRVLSRRVAGGTWDRALAGDLVMLDGSHSFFPVARPDSEIAGRVAAGDLHPTGPLWGHGEPATAGEVRALELDEARGAAGLAGGLAAARLEQQRRALRVPVREWRLDWAGPAVLELRFLLPAGCFATAVLRELVRADQPARRSST